MANGKGPSCGNCVFSEQLELTKFSCKKFKILVPVSDQYIFCEEWRKSVDDSPFFNSKIIKLGYIYAQEAQSFNKPVALGEYSDFSEQYYDYHLRVLED